MRSALLVLLVLAVLGVFAVYTWSPDTIAQAADQVRNIVGPKPVALAEDIFYAALDRYNQWAYHDKTTPGFWSVAPTVQPTTTAQNDNSSGLKQELDSIWNQVHAKLPSLSTSKLASTPSGTDASPASTLPTLNAPALSFRPRNVMPMYPRLAAPGEGVWVPLPNAFDSAAPPLMFKTFLHPDPDRSYAQIAIVAIDTSRVRLHTVAGTEEPVSPVHIARTGLIPQSDLPNLVAAFNGGFRSIHGGYAMMVGGQTLLPPKSYGDTIALYKDGSIAIAPWSIISPTLPLMDSYRQTPPYLAYHGQVDLSLNNQTSAVWGATVTRETVIWRSAIGLSADKRTLYYGAGESLTALRLAQAMVAAGASDVAELDVNLSYERFLTYDPLHANFNGVPLLSAMNTKPKLYTFIPSTRDFFYLTLAPTAH